MTADRLAVVLPFRHRHDALEAVLDGLEAQTTPGFETIIVVDGTDQHVPQRAEVRTIVQEQAGPAAARNRGARVTDRDLVLFLGADMVPTPGLVAAHLARHARHPEPGSAVLGKVAWHPDVADDALRRWLEWSRSQFDLPADDEEEAGTGRFYSCNVSVKRNWFLDAGGFDPSYAFDYEDLDCALRLAPLGLRVWYEPRALVHHLHAQTWEGMLARFASKATGEHHFVARHPHIEPFFSQRVESAASMPPVPRALAALADRPAAWGVGRARLWVDRHHHQRVAVPFLATWDDLADRSHGCVGAGRRLSSSAVLASMAAPSLRPGDRVRVVGCTAPSLQRRLDLLGAKVVGASDDDPVRVAIVPDADVGDVERAADSADVVVVGCGAAAAPTVLATARRRGLLEWRRDETGAVAVRLAGTRRPPALARLLLARRPPSPPVVATR